MLVILRVPTLLMATRSAALSFKDVEVVGLFVKEVINGEVIVDLLKATFAQVGVPCQILTDGGSDLAKGVRMTLDSCASPSPQCVHTLDIGHFAANVLKHVYIDNEQFKQLVAFATQIGSKLRQTVAAWVIPNKLRTKARFQSISELAHWAKKSFEYCKKHLINCEEKTRNLLEENFQGHEYLVEFSERFTTDCQVVNEVLMTVKNNGLSKETYSKSMKILSRLKSGSEIRQPLEKYLTTTFQSMSSQGIATSIISTDVIESLFGKIKSIIERSPTKDFNRLCLLLPHLVGDLDEDSIIKGIKEIKMKDIQHWDEENIKETLLRKKRKEFAKLRPNRNIPKHAKIQLENGP